MASTATTVVEERFINRELRICIGNLLLKRRDESKVEELVCNEVKLLIEARQLTLLPQTIIEQYKMEV